MTTVNVLTAAVENGCERVILAGSLEEPNKFETNIPCSPYAAAKSSVSIYARMFHMLYQLPVVILRIFMVYGPGQNDFTKLVPYVISCLLRGEAPRISSGERKVDWIFVDDVVDAFILAASAPAVEGSTVDVGSGTLLSIRSFVEQLVRLSNSDIQPLFGALPDRPFEQIRVADTDSTYRMLGWKPATPLERGLRTTIRWYRDSLSQISETAR
jgi:nucleoside-diphosphate-sugar epimerase